MIIGDGCASGKTRMISAWCDGSILRNPGGMGGWAFLVRGVDGYEFSSAGAEPETTNNRMELRAAIEVLVHLLITGQGGALVTIHTDSQYVIRGCSGVNRRVVNLDLFEKFDTLAEHFLRIEWQWVKGHSGVPENEFVDVAARDAARAAAAVEVNLQALADLGQEMTSESTV